MTLQADFCRETTGHNLARLEDFLAYLRAHLPPAKYETAVDLLHCAVSPAHAARRQREPLPPAA